MKQLLIIGNGFDLACGLKSKYIDFYNAVIKDKYKFDFINNNIWALDQFIEAKNCTNIPEKDFWQYLLTCYSKSEEKSQNYNWCNIEDIIRKTLRSININPNYCDEAWRLLEVNNYEININDEIHGFILSYCVKYFEINHEYDIPNESFSTKTPAKLRNSLNNHLLTELKKLEKLFCEFIKAQIIASLDNKLEHDHNSYLINTYKLFNKLIGFTNLRFVDLKVLFSLIESNSHINYEILKNTSVLSFNYINPMAILQNVAKRKICEYSNVHGQICRNNKCESCSSSNVIFGIDDSEVQSNIKANDIRIFSKTYRTLCEQGEKSILPLVNELGTIKFFGHSLNEADYSYFQSIFDYYNIYENTKITLEFYYMNFNPEAKKEMTDAVYKLINQYGFTRDNKDQGKNLMHKLILEKRIRIIEIIDF